MEKITMEFTKEELSFLQWAMVVTKVEAESDIESGIGNKETALADIDRANDFLKRFGKAMTK